MPWYGVPLTRIASFVDGAYTESGVVVPPSSLGVGVSSNRQYFWFRGSGGDWLAVVSPTLYMFLPAGK